MAATTKTVTEATEATEAVEDNPTTAVVASKEQGSSTPTLKGEVTQAALAKALNLDVDAIFAFRDYQTYVNVVTIDGKRIRVERSAK